MCLSLQYSPVVPTDGPVMNPNISFCFGVLGLIGVMWLPRRARI